MLHWIRRLFGLRVQDHPAPGDLPRLDCVRVRVVEELPEQGERIGDMVIHSGRVRVWTGDHWSRGYPHDG